jgi:sialate O-acetylesterase
MFTPIRTALGAVIVTAAFSGQTLAATASLDPLFGDHMVLQREQPIRVWGRANAGTRVSLNLAGLSASATTDASGEWSVELSALPAGGPHELQLRSGNEVIRTLADVKIGDVFLCSGQSNMEWPVSRSSGAWG